MNKEGFMENTYQGMEQRGKKRDNIATTPNRHTYQRGPGCYEFVLFWGRSEAKQENTVILWNFRESTI